MTDATPPFRVIEHDGKKLVIGPADMGANYSDNSVKGERVWAEVQGRTYPDAAETIAHLLNVEYDRRAANWAKNA